MKNYKDFEKSYIGESDIASLVLCGFKKEEGVVTELLHFGKDAAYMAYIVDEDTEIGGHYEKVAEFNSWLKIYDDYNLVKDFEGTVIEIYRAREMGCIIRVIK